MIIKLLYKPITYLAGALIGFAYTIKFVFEGNILYVPMALLFAFSLIASIFLLHNLIKSK